MTREVRVVVPSAEGIVERWIRQYPLGQARGRFDEISRKLMELPQEAGADEVVAVIGNKSWTHPQCAACYDNVDRAVACGGLGLICGPCLRAALVALGGDPAPDYAPKPATPPETERKR